MHALSLIANAYGSLIIALHPWPALGATHACRSILAELARRLLELAGWLAGRVEGRRLRRFERAYFPLRRWHLGLGERLVLGCTAACCVLPSGGHTHHAPRFWDVCW